MDRHSSKEASLASPCRTSLTLNEEEHEERDALLENITWNEKKGSDESGPHKLRRNLLIYVIGILSLSNLICIAVISIICLHRSPPEIASRPSWAPPERYETRLFEYVDAYGGEPGPESEAAWTDLIPVGKGWIKIHNETALPVMPGLNQSLPEQRALVSVFHQLHCLYMTRAGYFAARDGNITEVNVIHLSHCWDYLRQAIMCHSDTTLEWLPAPPDNVGSTGWGYEHQCKDYDAIFAFTSAHRAGDRHVIHG